MNLEQLQAQSAAQFLAARVGVDDVNESGNLSFAYVFTFTYEGREYHVEVAAQCVEAE